MILHALDETWHSNISCNLSLIGAVIKEKAYKVLIVGAMIMVLENDNTS